MSDPRQSTGPVNSCSEPASGEITELLVRWSTGDREAGEHDTGEQLLAVIYDELHQLAASYLRRERSSHTLQTSELVHEAYLRLIDQRQVRWQNRAHFFGIAAQAMRRILVDHARRRLYAKRGGAICHLSLEQAPELLVERASELVALDEALQALAAFDEEQARIVEMRYFAGLSSDEIALVLGRSARTVSRRWRMARAWLYHELNSGDPHPP